MIACFGTNAEEARSVVLKHELARDSVAIAHAIAFSPDDKTLAIGRTNGKIKLWDIDSRQMRLEILAHSDWVNDLTYSPDGRLIASASQDATVRMWDSHTGELLTTLRGHALSANGVCFTPTGNAVVSSGGGQLDGNLLLRDVSTGDLLGGFRGHELAVRSIAVSPDGQTLVSCSFDKTIRLWDIATFEQRAVFTGHTEKVSGVAVSPNGSTLASVSPDATVRLWDVSSGKEKHRFAGFPRAHHSFVLFSPDGTMLCLPSVDGRAAMQPLDGHEEQFVIEGLADIDAAFSFDGTMIATSSTAGMIQLFDARSGTLIASVDETQITDDYRVLTPEIRSELDLFAQEASQVHWKNKRAPSYATDHALSLKYSHIFTPALHYGGDHPITLDAWVRPIDASAYACIVGDPEGGGMGLISDGLKFGFGVHNGTNYQLALSNNQVVAGQLVHLAGVFDGSHVKLFVDGILQDDSVKLDGHLNPSTMPITIGANPGRSFTVTNFFHGVIDEVRISKVARYSGNFTPASRFTPDDDTMALYHFDEGQGEIVHDASENGHHGLIQNATWVDGIGGASPHPR
ncbi:MAG: hypothetical protein O3C40_29360 [Planctomycetota bacterium]|nr:hypothetical protein [Planctomycetota bacterium]